MCGYAYLDDSEALFLHFEGDNLFQDLLPQSRQFMVVPRQKDLETTGRVLDVVIQPRNLSIVSCGDSRTRICQKPYKR